MKQTDTLFERLLNYGGMGILVIVVLIALWLLVKYFIRTNRQLLDSYRQIGVDYAAEIKHLHEKIDKYIDEDRRSAQETIQRNTEAFNEHTKAFANFTEIVEELRQEIHNKK